MTKEITKAIILQEIQNKFTLREFDSAKFLFDETVVPVYNIEQHLTRPYTDLNNPSVTGTGGVECFEVPDNEIWTLSVYELIFMTGVFTAAGVYIDRVEKHSSNATFYLDLTADQNTSYTHVLPQPVVLYPGDKIMVNIDGYTSTGVFWLIADVLKETIR